MAYNELLAQRVRSILQDQSGFSEKQMFGGLCFLLNGNMCSGIVRDELMLRVGPEQHETAVADKHARPMDFTGRPMKGMIYVGADGIATEAALKRWIQMATHFTGALPAKKPKKSSVQRKREK
jgi:TfoX/Sxy family transcriptional regulator of competence genes